MHGEKMSFAAAIDAMCVAAGCEWWVEASDNAGVLLVISASKPSHDTAVPAAGEPPH